MSRPDHLKRVLCEIQVPYIVDLRTDDPRLSELRSAAQEHHYALARPQRELRFDASQPPESTPLFPFYKLGRIDGTPHRRVLALRPHVLLLQSLDYDGFDGLKDDILPLARAFFEAFDIDLITRLAVRYSNVWVDTPSVTKRFPKGFFSFANDNDVGEVSQYYWRMKGTLSGEPDAGNVEYEVQVGKGTGAPAVADMAALMPKSSESAIILDIECFTSDLDRAHIKKALDVTHRSARKVFGWLYKTKQERRAHGGESI